MAKERIFLITKVIKNELVVLGYVKGELYPADIANNQEKAKEMFGYDYVNIHELSERCFAKLGKLDRNFL